MGNDHRADSSWESQGAESEPMTPRGRKRIRSGLRRHGLIRPPEPIRRLVQLHGVRFAEGNRVSLFETGREGLATMLDEIHQAQHSIHFETYIFRSDSTGQLFLDAMTERARAGVAVRLLYDGVGSRGLEREALEPLERAGGDVVSFNPLGLLYPRFAPRRRDHRKILVVDDRVAFTGGMNIGDEYGCGPGDGEPAWRDAHVRVEGPAVRDLAAVFLESWFRADGPDVAWHELLAAEPAACGNVRCAVLADGPVYRRRRMRDLLVSALENAARDVKLESPYFAPGRRVLDALSSASRRGVAVELLLAGKSDHPVLRRASRSILPRLLACGVRVYEYERSMMHAKAAVFDSEWAVIGTSNLDRQSFEHSYEVNLILEGGDVPTQLSARFGRDLTGARPIDEASLAGRGPIERLVDGLAALLMLFI